MHLIRRCDHMTEGEEGILSANTGRGENVFVSDVHYTTPRSARVAHIAAKIGRLHTQMILYANNPNGHKERHYFRS